MTLARIRPEETAVQGGVFTRVVSDWVGGVTRLLTGQDYPQVPRRTVAQLTALDASKLAGRIAICTDESGGETMCWCDGTVWRRTSDGTEIMA